MWDSPLTMGPLLHGKLAHTIILSAESDPKMSDIAYITFDIGIHAGGPDVV